MTTERQEEMMIVKNMVYAGQQLTPLTECLVKTTEALRRTQKHFSKCKIVLEEPCATEFMSALTQLIAEINQLEKEDID